MTSIAGISASSSTRAVDSRSRRRRERSTTTAERNRINSTLPISDAWKENSGRLIARVEPRAA